MPEVLVYGHWGRRLLLFPAEQGSAYDAAHHGLVDAVGGLLEAGRIKLYCVDSFDGSSWSARHLPLEERARAHEQYEAWIVHTVAPFIARDCGQDHPMEIIAAGCSLGAYHALNVALRHADLFPLAMCFSTSSISGATTCRTTGRPGAPSSPTTCRASVETEVPALTRHLIGLLLGTEEDWPTAFTEIVRRLGPVTDGAGRKHEFDVERVTIEPFDLRYKPRHALVIDRLAYWYYHPREWLKKIALMDDVYLLNSPFTFQSMEKHAAYCAMMRLGLKVPDTVLVPFKHPVDNARWAYTASRYNRSFDLDGIAERLGYPLFMKPYDGGAWVGVSRVRNSAELHAAYDQSGERLMHLQASIEGYDAFARSLSIGAETMVMKFRPELPMHDRYAVDHAFLDAQSGWEVTTISKVVNAFFRWEFNSCEALVRGADVHPIDYANACPDVALTSLHYYFPWAIAALVRWSVFCCVTGRRPRLDLDTSRYFEIADRTDLSYVDKLGAYRRLADDYFESERYQDFCASRLSTVDDVVYDWVSSPDFDKLLVDTVRATYPPFEHEQFIAHFRGLLAAWIKDQGRG